MGNPRGRAPSTTLVGQGSASDCGVNRTRDATHRARTASVPRGSLAPAGMGSVRPARIFVLLAVRETTNWQTDLALLRDHDAGVWPALGASRAMAGSRTGACANEGQHAPRGVRLASSASMRLSPHHSGSHAGLVPEATQVAEMSYRLIGFSIAPITPRSSGRRRENASGASWSKLSHTGSGPTRGRRYRSWVSVRSPDASALEAWASTVAAGSASRNDHRARPLHVAVRRRNGW